MQHSPVVEDDHTDTVVLATGGYQEQPGLLL
jgi:hypothetical protein